MDNPDKVKDRRRLQVRRPTWRAVWRQVQLLLVMLDLVMCTVTRPQVNELKGIIADVDEDAFITIGMSHQALGSGFSPLQHKR